MIVDPSVLIAVLLREEGYEYLEQILETAPELLISAGGLLEMYVVVYRRFSPAHISALDELLYELKLTIVPFDDAQAAIAREAYGRFGKGRHPAALNFGDCFSYALSKRLSKPLLFKGKDFSQTDVLVAHSTA